MQKQLLFFLFIAFLTLPKVLFSSTHLSITKNYELETGESGFDVTFFTLSSLGLRYLELPNQQFGETYETNKDGELILSEFQGDLKTYQFLKTVDFRNYGPNHLGPFEMITAYYGFGYNQLQPKVKSEVYSASNNSLISREEESQGDLILRSATFGVYGMEKNVVIDGRVLWLQGTLSDEELLNGTREFQKIQILVSLGIGF